MTNDIKQRILDEIQHNSTVFKKVSNVQYRTRCPICGDSQSNPKDAHCYIKCDFSNPSEPLLYNCFKCNNSGKVTSKFLKYFGIKSDLINIIDEQRFNKISSIKSKNVDIITGSPIMNSPQVKYIERRLGGGFTADDYNKFKILWNIENVSEYITSARSRNTLPNNNESITFLSDDNSVLLIRSFDDNGYRWRKLSLFQSGNKSFYTIKTTLDLFSQDKIVVNIAEGVLDVLSIYKNFNENNSAYIATLGSDYISGVEYAISKGLIGSNVILKIYMDGDLKDEKSIKYSLKKYKWVFGSIVICKNILYKDVGIDINKIKLIEKKL